MTITHKLRQAYRFHHEHGAYCTPPGRAQCALNAARAELRAIEIGLAFDWLDDDAGWDRDDDYTPETVEGCVCYGPEDDNGKREVLASLWGIADADDDYRRVVESELASEALDQVDWSEAELMHV